MMKHTSLCFFKYICNIATWILLRDLNIITFEIECPNIFASFALV